GWGGTQASLARPQARHVAEPATGISRASGSPTGLDSFDERVGATPDDRQCIGLIDGKLATDGARQDAAEGCHHPSDRGKHAVPSRDGRRTYIDDSEAGDQQHCMQPRVQQWNTDIRLRIVDRLDAELGFDSLVDRPGGEKAQSRPYRSIIVDINIKTPL